MLLWSAWFLMLLPIPQPSASSPSSSTASAVAAAHPLLSEIDGLAQELVGLLGPTPSTRHPPDPAQCHQAKAVAERLHEVAAGCRGTHAVEVLQVDSRALQYSPMWVQCLLPRLHTASARAGERGSE